MEVLKHLIRKITVKRKILNIQNDIRNLLKNTCPEKFEVTWYGAYYIDPKYLVYWICIQSDKVKQQLKEDISLNAQLRSLLKRNNYPVEAQKFVHIGFESQETVDRESDGNWYLHFK